MAHEDLIYRITRAVYDRLGTTAEEQTVEQLVTDIYRQVEPFIQTNGTPYSTPRVCQIRAVFRRRLARVPAIA